MKSLICIAITILFLFGCKKSDETYNEQKHEYVGVSEIGSATVEYHNVDVKNGEHEKIGTLAGVSSLLQGVFTFDNVENRFILETDIGITVVDIYTGEVLNVFSGITEIEFNPLDSMLYGVHRSDSLSTVFFAKADVMTGEVTIINEIPSVNAILQGNSTFDYDLGRYCFITDDGVMVIDYRTGEVLNTFGGIHMIEYDHSSGKLIGLSEDVGGQILSADMESGTLEEIWQTSINSVVQGVSTYDQVNQNYVIVTESGVTVIDILTGSILMEFSGLTEIEYLNNF